MLRAACSNPALSTVVLAVNNILNQPGRRLTTTPRRLSDEAPLATVNVTSGVDGAQRVIYISSSSLIHGVEIRANQLMPTATAGAGWPSDMTVTSMNGVVLSNVLPGQSGLAPS